MSIASRSAGNGEAASSRTGDKRPLTLVWSHRPRSLQLALFIAAYVSGAGFAQSLAIVPGTGISIWPPSGLFIATLVITSRRSWPWWVLGALLAELIGNFAWFHNPPHIALLLIVGNALEAMGGAWLVNRTFKRPVRLETLQEVVALVVLGAGVAPLISATVGSATLALFGVQPFATAWPLWWIGDATGVLIVAPLALVVVQNWRAEPRLSAGRWTEALVLGLIFLGAAALSLSGYLPTAYLIMPPLLWAAVRFEFRGAAVTLALLALITAVFTISGLGHFAGAAGSRTQNQIMLQLFLAVSAFSALIVAAISRQHHSAALTLRQSEAALRERERELSQLVDMVPSHVWRLTPDGEPAFFNKPMVDFLGLDVADTERPDVSRLQALVEAVVHPEDAGRLSDALGHSLATGDGFATRYRLRRADGIYRWMSSRAAPMRDDRGRIVQWYGICHDIDDQVQAEDALRRASDKLAQATQAATLAELSASIAHEVNQPLAAIVANSYACHRWLSAEPPNVHRAKVTAERITRDANAAADVVDRIRALFRQAPRARPPESVNRLVGEICQLMADEIAGRDARVEATLDPDLPQASLDRVQVQQVLVNLIRNGIEAMAGVDGARVLEIRTSRDGPGGIRVEIRDTGPGFKDAERAFEPFFTTKLQGMGMGLAICRSVIESHGGRLWARNDEMGGAIVGFTLPLAATGMVEPAG